MSNQSKQESTPRTAAEIDRIIEPAAFEPPSDMAPVAQKRLSPTSLLALGALLIALLILWFLFSARSVLLEPTYNGEPVQGASFNVDGGVHLPFGGRYLMRPGRFVVATSHPEYLSTETPLQISDEAQQSVIIELQRRPDVFSLNSVPDGAEIIIDGESLGETPMRGVSLDPGDHTVHFKHPRYLLHEELIAVEGGGNSLSKEITLKPAWAELSINTEPEGAEVTSDERSLGITPLIAEVYQGTRTLNITLERFAPHSETIDVVAGEAITIDTIELAPANAKIEVSSIPSDAGVLVNGEFRGQTPLTVQLEPNKDTVLELFKQGYQKQTRTVQYAAGETDQLALSLKAALGTILLDVKPSDAQVRVNGRLLNKISGTLKLPSIPHDFVVSREGYLPFKKTLTPRPGFNQALSVRLLTPAAAKAARMKPVLQNPVGQTMRLIKPGQITLGASRREAGRRANEGLRRVELKRPFYIAATEVTNGQFRQFDFKHTSSRVEDKSLNSDSQPVVRISWIDAAQFCNWLSEKEKLPKVYVFKGDELQAVNQAATGYRLPTEAEWAWSARALAGQTLKFPWGQDWPPPPKAGNFADVKAAYVLGRTLPYYEDGFVASSPVGKFTPNQYDLFDMGGNVAEWVHDFYAPGQATGSAVDPFGPEESNFHVVRGSSWRHGSMVELRLSYRDYADRPRDDLGFRVARYAE